MMMEVFFTGNVKAEKNAGETGAEWQTDTVYEGNGRTGNGAFDGIGSGATYTVPRVKAQAYKKLLIAKGADL